jgi:hypothetical protein
MTRRKTVVSLRKMTYRTRKLLLDKIGKAPEKTPEQVTLFGFQSVTPEDIAAWLLAVPKIDPHGPRAVHYVQGYDVVTKIAQAKAAGTFYNTVKEYL